MVFVLNSPFGGWGAAFIGDGTQAGGVRGKPRGAFLGRIHMKARGLGKFRTKQNFARFGFKRAFKSWYY
jgi:hypothetical protein